MTACYCGDIEAPEFYRASRPIARKPHRCDECNRLIQPGERYERAAGKWSGRMDTFATCVYCIAIVDMLDARLPCFCRTHGGLMNEFDSWWGEMPAGLQFAVGRILVECRRDPSA